MLRCTLCDTSLFLCCLRDTTSNSTHTVVRRLGHGHNVSNVSNVSSIMAPYQFSGGIGDGSTTSLHSRDGVAASHPHGAAIDMATPMSVTAIGVSRSNSTHSLTALHPVVTQSFASPGVVTVASDDLNTSMDSGDGGQVVPRGGITAGGHGRARAGSDASEASLGQPAVRFVRKRWRFTRTVIQSCRPIFHPFFLRVGILSLIGRHRHCVVGRVCTFETA